MGKPRKPDFSSAYLKLYRAKAHIEEFKTAASEFFAENPYVIFPEIDPVSKDHGFVIGNKRAFPIGLGLMVGDAIHNLRAALDHLIAACARANGGDEKNTHFPIRKTKIDFEDGLKRDVLKPGAGRLAADLVRKVKPYRRGNGALFAIHHLDLADKHRLLVPIKYTLHASITLEDADGAPTFDRTFSSLDKKRRFIAIPAGMKDKLLPADTSTSSDIVFAPNLPRSGKPCVEELAEFFVATERVLSLFRASF
jgi:hypothetical protein